MKLRNKIFLVFILVTIGSCSNFDEAPSTNFASIQDKQGSDHVSIIFSNNINGETHPCGCRHFPLGGLPQVAGKFAQINKKSSALYVDSGDTLFGVTKLPKLREKSMKHKAQKIAEALDKLGLDFFTPGDQDFAAGVDFLANLSQKVKFRFLVANLKANTKIKHIRWAKIKSAKTTFFLTGIISPGIMPYQLKDILTSPQRGFNEALKLMKQNGYNETNINHRLILLSHSGIDDDLKFAKQNPQLDWIIGSHTQSFIQVPRQVNKTKTVQVLSRNHYLGEIKFYYQSKTEDKYLTHEVRDELQKELKPNPFVQFLSDLKLELDKIYQIEQQQFESPPGENPKVAHIRNCTDCHQKQINFWQGTSHANAFSTLVKVKEEKNPECMKCHTVHMGKDSGFVSHHDVILFQQGDDESYISPKSKEHNDKHNAYWLNYKRIYQDIESVRKLSETKRKSLARKQFELDDKYKVFHNFTNVQCFNCHNIPLDHPFENGLDQELEKDAKYKAIKSRCLACHTPDQSLEWYKDGKVDEAKFIEHLRAVACPKGES